MWQQNKNMLFWDFCLLIIFDYILFIQWNENLPFQYNKIIPLWFFIRYSTLFHLHVSPAMSKNRSISHTSYIFEGTSVSRSLPWQGKQKCQVSNVGMKSEIVMFATSTYLLDLRWVKLNKKHHNKFKAVLTNCHCKLPYFWAFKEDTNMKHTHC